MRRLPNYDPFALARETDYIDLSRGEQFLDLWQEHIKIPDGDKAGQPMPPGPHMESVLLNVYSWYQADGNRRFREVIIYVPKKNSKALALDTPIPTPTGWTTMGQIQTGDIVFDENGQQCNVLGVSDIMTGNTCYEVVFSDGTSVVADAGHLWETNSRLPEQKAGIHTTQEIADTLRVEYIGSEGWNHSIQVASELQTEYVDLPIPPYALGAWLGDGTSSAGAITCCGMDYAIIEHIRATGVNAVLKNRSDKTKTPQYSLDTMKQRSRVEESFTRRLRNLGVLGNKHIPQIYLRANTEQRRELLCGLMDTDGCASKAGQLSFTSNRRVLVDGVLELLRSLGYKPTLREDRAMIGDKDCGPYWQIQFWAFNGEKIFKLERKSARQKNAPKNKPRSKTRHIVACKPVPSVPVRCIKVDSPSNLYLCGLGMVPTHNTSDAAAWAAIEFQFLSNHGAQFYSCAANREQAGLVYKAWANILHFDEELREGIQVYGEKGPGTIKSIVKAGEHKSYKPLSRDADSGDGVGPDFLIIDELHRHPDGELMETLEKSTAAKRNALIIKTSTADYDRPSPCNRMIQRARLICANPGDPSLPGYAPKTLSCIYEISPQEYKDNPNCWKDLDVWRRANPNWGVTITEEFAKEQIQLAIDDPSTLNNLLRLHLNIVTEQSEVWMPMDKYDLCQDGRTDNEFIDDPCWFGFDVSTVNDLTSFSLAWKHPEGGYDMRWWFWLPGDGIADKEKKDGVPYTQWERDGYLELVPGEVIDQEYLKQRIFDICEKYNIQNGGADPFQNSWLMQQMENQGIECLKFPQNAGAITEPAKELMKSVIEGKFRHNRNPVARWNFSNAIIKKFPNDTFRLDKDKAERRIDGVAAAIMAVGMVIRQSLNPRSAYESQGVLSGGY